jgi:tripeptidyl-peptidase-1
MLVSQANQLLGASYQLYRNTKTNNTIIRTVGYALPAVLHTHIQAVAPTTHFASKRVMRQTPRRRSFGVSEKLFPALSSRATEVVPAFLHWLYETDTYEPIANGKNTLAILGLEDEQPSQKDLTTFMTDFQTGADDATFIVIQVNNGEYDPSNPTIEASVDVQYAEAIAYPTPVIFYSIGGDEEWLANGKPAPGDVYLEWFLHMLREPDIPQTISIPYSDFEYDYPGGICESLVQLVLTARCAGQQCPRRERR